MLCSRLTSRPRAWGAAPSSPPELSAVSSSPESAPAAGACRGGPSMTAKPARRAGRRPCLAIGSSMPLVACHEGCRCAAPAHRSPLTDRRCVSTIAPHPIRRALAHGEGPRRVEGHCGQTCLKRCRARRRSTRDAGRPPTVLASITWTASQGDGPGAQRVLRLRQAKEAVPEGALRMARAAEPSPGPAYWFIDRVRSRGALAPSPAAPACSAGTRPAGPCIPTPAGPRDGHRQHLR